jgi:hypothetical protein
VQFTLWPSKTGTTGGHGEITWETLLSFVASPVVAAVKDDLEGWSPARFKGHARARANVELVSCIVLDDDATGLPLKQLAQDVWFDFAGAIHTSHSHTAEKPKYRIVLRCSRDMTADEHARVWLWVRDLALGRGQTIDEATKDPSRLWFVPAHREGAAYAWCPLLGKPIDVDAVLAESGGDVMPRAGSKEPPAPPPALAGAERNSSDRRTAMAAALRAAWPSKGRHLAQLALAGALRAEGWTPEDAIDFLEAVAGDRTKREATVRRTWAREAGAPLTGWTTLKAHVDPVVVDAVRAGLGRGAEWNEKTARRLAEAAEYRPVDIPIAPAIPSTVPTGDTATTVQAGPFTFTAGGLDAPLPPLVYLVDGLFCRADVAMLVAHGNSLKTWTAFSLGLAIATGRPWLGRFVTQRGRVALIDFESGDFEVRRRLKLLGAKDADTGGRLMWSAYSGAQLADPETWIALAGLKLDLVVVDSFAAASPGEDENDARAALMLQHAGRFAEVTGCAVLFIHHARKGTGGDRREAVRGSTALFAACDRIFEFTDPESKDGGIELTTMRSIKNGAGRRPVNVRVELSDQGLKFVEVAEEPIESAEKVGNDKNRELVLETLRKHPSGVLKEHLVNLMKGKRDAKYQTLSALLLSNVMVEFTDRASGKFGKTVCMLNPNIEQ